MPSYTVYLQGGPCGGRTEQRFFYPSPPATLTCGGHVYEFEPGASGAALWYVARGSAFDITPDKVRGRRDLLRAWHGLGRELAYGTLRQVHHLRRAGHRIRRAVR